MEAGQEAAAETKQGSEETQPETVAKERFDEQQVKLKEAEEQNALLQENQAIIKANTPVVPAANAFDIYKEVGLNPDDPDDIPTQAQQKKINGYFQAVRAHQDAKARFQREHPDYYSLVGTDEQTTTGQFAEPLKIAIRANSTLMTALQNSPRPWELAYSNAKQHAKKKDEKPAKTEAQAAIDEAVANSERIKVASNTKGGLGLSEEGQVATMSEAEFIKLANSVGADL